MILAFSPAATSPGKASSVLSVMISPDRVPASRTDPSISPRKDPPKATFNVVSIAPTWVSPVTTSNAVASSVRVVQSSLVPDTTSVTLVRKLRLEALATKPSGRPARSAVATLTSTADQLRKLPASSITKASSAETPLASNPVAPSRSAKAIRPVMTVGSARS